VIHAIEKIESELKLDPSLQSTITELISLIRRG
jgi:chromosomal replication initiation ATPase DnaA